MSKVDHQLELFTYLKATKQHLLLEKASNMSDLEKGSKAQISQQIHEMICYE